MLQIHSGLNISPLYCIISYNVQLYNRSASSAADPMFFAIMLQINRKYLSGTQNKGIVCDK